MTTTSLSDIPEHPELVARGVNLEEIHTAAVFAAQALTPYSEVSHAGAVLVDLSPGDATTYRFVLVSPHSPRHTTDGRTQPTALGHELIVTLANDFGDTYPWDYITGPHWTYAADKWDRHGREHTGRIVAAFLGYVSEELARLERVASGD